MLMGGGKIMLDIHNVSFGYEHRDKILQSVSLHVRQGKIIGLIGPNGSGKTTLINLVCDVLDLRKGNIAVLGLRHTSAEAKISIMHVGGNDDVPSFLTGWEYVSTLARLYGVRVDQSEVRRLFTLFGMEGAQNRLIDSYSHGMKKKTQLCCAFLLRCPLTIVDETLNGIDIDAWYLCVEQFLRMRDKGLSVLICSHDFALLEQITDEIVLLRNGRMGAPLPTRPLIDDYGGIAEWYRAKMLEPTS